MGHLQFGSENPDIRHKVKSAPVSPAGGRATVSGVEQKQCEAPFPALPFIAPRLAFVLEIECVVCRGLSKTTFGTQIRQTDSVEGRPGIERDLDQFFRRSAIDLRNAGMTFDFVREGGIDQIFERIWREPSCFPVDDGGNNNHMQPSARLFPKASPVPRCPPACRSAIRSL